MAIDFPNSPSTNDIFTSGGRSWIWTGATWQAYVQALSNGSITNDLIADTTITAAKIANATVTYNKLAMSNSIVDADINSSAAIAATKISGTAIVQSIVDAKGDLIVATAADTVARQGVGLNGQVLVADSGQTNGVAWVDPQTNRNVIINGAMQVAQRGTSVAGITGTNFTADRFFFTVQTQGTWTHSVESDAPTGSGLRNSTKLLCTTADATPAADDVVNLQHRFEGQNLQQFAKGTASAKPFALSFWVKSNVTGTYIAELFDYDNTRSVSASYTISASATWEKKTIIFPADTTGAFDNDNALSLDVKFFLGAGSNRTSGTLQTTWGAVVTANRAVGQTNLASAINNYWQVTGVQLEAGAVATPFEFEQISTTLAKCQRYYQRFTPTTTNDIFSTCFAVNTTALIACLQNQTMRALPSAVDFASLRAFDGVNVLAISAVSISASTAKSVYVDLTVAGATQFRSYLLVANTAPSYIGVSAEL